MGRLLDRRQLTGNQATRRRRARLRARAADLSLRLPGGVRIKSFNPLTGTPWRVEVPEPDDGRDLITRSLERVRSLSRALGFDPVRRPDWAPDPRPSVTSSGSRVVHLQQRHHGIDVFGASVAVRFTRRRALKDVTGTTQLLGVPRVALPRIRAGLAVEIAARHLAEPQPDELGRTDAFGEPDPPARVNVDRFRAVPATRLAPSPDRQAVFAAGPFAEPIPARLIWFPLRPGALHLAWEMLFVLPDLGGRYRVLVDARSRELLYVSRLDRQVAARGRVYTQDGGGQRELLDFPRPLAVYTGLGLPPGRELPAGFPDTWVEELETAGNAVRAHREETGPPAAGQEQGGVVVFDPADPHGPEQMVLNLFYYSCYLHDLFYVLGFREEDGNFQLSNLDRGEGAGLAHDRLDARAWPGAVPGTANMSTPRDGSWPTMNMGRVASTGRHTAFDASVVFHEYMHGVTSRLVGGPQNAFSLDEPQSAGMSEGWGDYLACTLLETSTVGSWVVAREAGIRRHPYTADYPAGFGDLGSPDYQSAHDVGEIWCATLLEMNRAIGRGLALQLVVDALKLSPANPSFLDMRDAILEALEDTFSAGQLTGQAFVNAHQGIWRAFARFGMGGQASSRGARLTDVVADTSVPPPPAVEVEVPAGQGESQHSEPQVPIPDGDPAGVSDVIRVTHAGPVERLSVSVDLAHPYVGDLRVALVSPAGTRVLLHDQTGASQNDLVTTYSSESASALTRVHGEEAAGAWRLEVADLAAQDAGTFRAWGLNLQVGAAASEHIQVETQPGVVIPDRDAAGVSSAIAVVEPGVIGSLAVSLDIRHPFVGDLRVELTAPGGAHAILHEPGQRSARDLIRTFDAATHPGLAAFLGQRHEGHWILRATDLAGDDQGVLRAWGLDIGRAPEGPRSVRRDAPGPALPIPDADPAGVTSGLEFEEQGVVAGLKVDVRVTHTFVGDLRLTLLSPTGAQAVLQDQVGSGNTINRVYDAAHLPALAALGGEPLRGAWKLNVADLAGQDRGKLVGWGLEISYRPGAGVEGVPTLEPPPGDPTPRGP